MPRRRRSEGDGDWDSDQDIEGSDDSVIEEEGWPPPRKRRANHAPRGRGGNTRRSSPAERNAAPSAHDIARLDDAARQEPGRGATREGYTQCTRKKYDSQLGKWRHFCAYGEDGRPRARPLDPSLATDDCLDKAAAFMAWVAENAPGWKVRRKAYVLSASTVRQIHAALKCKLLADHAAADPPCAPPVADLLDCREYKAAYVAAQRAAPPPDKGQRSNRGPQDGAANARNGHGAMPGEHRGAPAAGGYKQLPPRTTATRDDLHGQCHDTCKGLLADMSRLSPPRPLEEEMAEQRAALDALLQLAEQDRLAAEAGGECPSTSAGPAPGPPRGVVVAPAAAATGTGAAAAAGAATGAAEAGQVSAAPHPPAGRSPFASGGGEGGSGGGGSGLEHIQQLVQSLSDSQLAQLGLQRIPRAPPAAAPAAHARPAPALASPDGGVAAAIRVITEVLDCIEALAAAKRTAVAPRGGGGGLGAAGSAPAHSSSSNDGGGVVRVIRDKKTFRSVKDLVDWANEPFGGGPSRQQRERNGDPSWRQGQPHHHQRWRQINLVLQRVEALRQQPGRQLSVAEGVASAEAERLRLKKMMPGYIRHLEAEMAKQNKAAKEQAAAAAGG